MSIVHGNPNKLWRSNSIFNLCFQQTFPYFHAAHETAGYLVSYNLLIAKLVPKNNLRYLHDFNFFRAYSITFYHHQTLNNVEMISITIYGKNIDSWFEKPSMLKYGIYYST
jgi:hypothetical protein